MMFDEYFETQINYLGGHDHPLAWHISPQTASYS